MESIERASPVISTLFLRRWLYLTLFRMKGAPIGMYYKDFLQEYLRGISPNSGERLLLKLMDHCSEHVPYYATFLKHANGAYSKDPVAYLTQLPILTKEILRCEFERLKSDDLPRRKWFPNWSGGTTGAEPVHLIQDLEFAAKAGAITALFSSRIGRDIGECEAYIWGSPSEIKLSKRLRGRAINLLSNSFYLNSFGMTAESMRRFIRCINAKKPKLIIAYADSIYELALFAEREGLEVRSQSAIISTAGMLYHSMRGKIEAIFKCNVYNRYGSREVGDIACELPGIQGMFVAPWGNYIEIVNSRGDRVGPGEEGDILVTNLCNYAMPLIRYKIEDRGALGYIPNTRPDINHSVQILQALYGRSTDTFVTRSGALVHAGYFMYLFDPKNWVAKFQVVQNSIDYFSVKIVSKYPHNDPVELKQMTDQFRIVFGDNCHVKFEFVDSIVSSRSGKYRPFICEVRN